MKLINLRKLSELYLAYFNLWKRKWKIAFVFLNENTFTSTQSEWWLLDWTWLPLSTTTECSRNFAFSWLAFSLSLTDSKSIFSSSHLDYCSRIAGNASDQDVVALRRIILERVKSLNWQNYMQKKSETRWYWNTDEKYTKWNTWLQPHRPLRNEGLIN